MGDDPAGDASGAPAGRAAGADPETANIKEESLSDTAEEDDCDYVHFAVDPGLSYVGVTPVKYVGC